MNAPIHEVAAHVFHGQFIPFETDNMFDRNTAVRARKARSRGQQ